MAVRDGDNATQLARWQSYIEGVAEAVDRGKVIPLGPSPTPPVPPAVSAVKPQGASPKVLYCAPHPDDETLTGALALRLRLESGARVTNVAITLGSDRSHRERRRGELVTACQVLGFDLVIPANPGAASASGFEHVSLAARQADPKGWAEKVRVLAEIFDAEQPEALFAPHADDFNTTHIATHYLVIEALDEHLTRRPDTGVLLIETEFWHEMVDPNLMVAVTPELAAIQLTAAAEHGGEMMRNPYHLLHPCRLMNNVRRGSEVVAGEGKAAQPFTFAELYRISLRRGREAIEPRPGGHILPSAEKATLGWMRRQLPAPSADHSTTSLS
ncbi:MAG TPA: PIG-L family deacetylase [Terriglobia bacterium]